MSVADVVIAQLPIEAALIDEIVELTIDRNAYRELAQQALHTLHDLMRERDRLRAAHDRLRDQYRHLCAQTMHQVRT